jgi:predicted dehydrogenase
MEAFHYRYHPVFLRALDIVASGELGPLRNLEAHFCTPFLRPGDIRYRYDLAGGATMDLGCYAVHMLRALADAEPIVIHAEARCMSPNLDRRMDADLIFHDLPHARPGFSVRAHLVCSFFSSTPLRMILTAHGERGELRLLNPILPHFSLPTARGLLSHLFRAVGRRSKSEAPWGPQLHRLRVRTGSTWRTERYPGASTYTYQLQAFVRAIEDNQAPVTDAQDGLANMHVLDAIYARAGLALRQPAPLRAAQDAAYAQGSLP